MTDAGPAPILIDVLTRVGAVATARGVPCFVVGGLLRDQLLRRQPTHLNVDLAVPRGALAFCRVLAERLGGAFVVLDEAAGTARVVIGTGGQRVELDVSDFRGATIEEDLARRDFTINAMAVPLADWLATPSASAVVIDPLQGAQAVRRRRLQPCFPGAFEADPIRILRAFRLSAQLDFALDPSAAPLMAEALPRLAQASGERVRDELLAVLETDRAAGALRALNDLGALDVLLPELSAGRDVDQGDFHHLDVLHHQLEAVAQADRFLAGFAEFAAPLRAPLAAYCAGELVERRSRKSLIKLAALLHDIGKPSNRQVHDDGAIWFLGHEQAGAELAVPVLERLRLANREAEMVHRLILHHLRPGFLSRELHVTRRAIYRFFKDLGEDGPGCLLEWWADRMATRGPRSRLDQLDAQRQFLETMLSAYFFQAEELVTPPRLLDGHQLMQRFHLPAGPLIGELLAAVEEAQAEGHLRSSEEAVALVQEMLTRRPG